MDALIAEITQVGRDAPADLAVHTVFFGGGTPSLLPAKMVERILAAVEGAFRVAHDAEVTLEANPGTVTANGLRDLHVAGINRLSFGVQSANGEELRMLERTHDYGDVLRGVRAARRVGFSNINLDLIYGLPGQDIVTWTTTLKRVLQLQAEHVAAYCLTLEHGTPFGRWARVGMMPVPDADQAAEMYEAAEEQLAAAGYEHYEISNWARRGYECRHNLQYWRGEPYLGVGAGAHGYAAGYRYANVLGIKSYVERFQHRAGTRRTAIREAAVIPTRPFPLSAAAAVVHVQSEQDEVAEHMIMGMRLTDAGISAGGFASRFGRSLQESYGPQLARLVAAGLVEFAAEQIADAGTPRDERVRLTRRGRLLGNRVFAEFVEAPRRRASAGALTGTQARAVDQGVEPGPS